LPKIYELAEKLIGSQAFAGALPDAKKLELAKPIAQARLIALGEIPGPPNPPRFADSPVAELRAVLQVASEFEQAIN